MKNTVYGIQFLRFIAAYLVVAMHTSQTIAIRLTSEPHDYWKFGSIGVDLFFIISGYIMEITQNGSQDRPGLNYEGAKNFMKRRLIRIVPLYWIATILKIFALLSIPALAVRSTLETDHIIASFLFIPYMAPWGLIEPILPVGWTLDYEMLFYVIFSIIILTKSNRIIFTALAFSVLFLIPENSSTQISFYSKSIIFEFYIGIVIASITRNKPLNSKISIALVLAGIALIALDLYQVTGNRAIGFGIPCGLILWGVVGIEDLVRKSREFKIFSHLGDSSYSTYLFHTFIIPATVVILTRVGITNHSAIFIISLAITIPICHLIFMAIEKPITEKLKSII